jgi:hypothetical protein
MRLAQCCRRCTYILCGRYKFLLFPVVGGSVVFVVTFEKISREAVDELSDNFVLIIMLGSLELIDALV